MYRDFVGYLSDLEVMTMVSHRSRVTRPAVALWLFVLVADTAAAGSLTLLAYALAGVIAVALVLAEVRGMTARRDQLKLQPARVRAVDPPYDRRRPGR
jgi:hypothetical protein